MTKNVALRMALDATGKRAIMNERIKELATKAGLPTYNPGGLPTKLEMFAELIVKEICDVFDKRAEPNTGFYEPHEPAKLIKEHFGIEP